MATALRGRAGGARASPMPTQSRGHATRSQPTDAIRPPVPAGRPSLTPSVTVLAVAAAVATAMRKQVGAVARPLPSLVRRAAPAHFPAPPAYRGAGRYIPRPGGAGATA